MEMVEGGFISAGVEESWICCSVCTIGTIYLWRRASWRTVLAAWQRRRVNNNRRNKNLNWVAKMINLRSGARFVIPNLVLRVEIRCVKGHERQWLWFVSWSWSLPILQPYRQAESHVILDFKGFIFRDTQEIVLLQSVALPLWARKKVMRIKKKFGL